MGEGAMGGVRVASNRSRNSNHTHMHSTCNMFRLQLYLILKSDWSGAWLLLPIVTQTVNSIVPAGYSRKIVLLCVKWNLFLKSHSS